MLEPMNLEMSFKQKAFCMYFLGLFVIYTILKYMVKFKSKQKWSILFSN